MSENPNLQKILCLVPVSRDLNIFSKIFLHTKDPKDRDTGPRLAGTMFTFVFIAESSNDA